MSVDPMERDEREDKLPAWARGIITDLRLALRNEIASANVRVGEAEMENSRLRALTDDRRNASGDADTFLEDEEVPLGRGTHVRFADFYTAHYGTHETTGGARVLVVETDKPMQVRPLDLDRVIIARA
jgi:hypothetical protein